jgi:radical SAM superfamily enzyme with C-terminal helix-hairpin-helix motif
MILTAYNTSQVQIATWNVRGLGKNCEKLKDDEVINVFEKYHIMCLLETWHTATSKLNVKGFSSFNVIRGKKKKKGRNSGGIIVYCKNAFRKGIKQLKSGTADTVWLQQ